MAAEDSINTEDHTEAIPDDAFRAWDEAVTAAVVFAGINLIPAGGKSENA